MFTRADIENIDGFYILLSFRNQRKYKRDRSCFPSQRFRLFEEQSSRSPRSNEIHDRFVKPEALSWKVSPETTAARYPLPLACARK